MTNKEDIIAKIKKCLALGKSANEHEAATALRQAQKLMELHGITNLDIETADISEAKTRAGAATKPTNWEVRLVHEVCEAFGCQCIFQTAWRSDASWLIVGIDPAPEISRYAFEVLFRQIKRARARHIKTKLKRCGPTSRTRRADLFCLGWVMTATELLAAFVNPEAQQVAIDGYIEHKYECEMFTPTNRSAGRSLSERDMGDWAAGRHAGRGAQLNRGVGTAAVPLALE